MIVTIFKYPVQDRIKKNAKGKGLNIRYTPLKYRLIIYGNHINKSYWSRS